MQVYFQKCINIDNDIWFSAANINGLYKYNLQNKQLEWKGTFPKEEQTEGLHFEVLEYKYKLIFIPQYALHIAVYDILANKFKMLDIPDCENYNDEYPKFLQGRIYKDKLFVVGYGCSLILNVNLQDYSIKKIFIEFGELNSLNAPFGGTRLEVLNNIMYVPCGITNAVIKLNMSDNTYEILHIGNVSDNYLKIISYKDFLLLLTRKTQKLIWWSLVEDTFEERDISISGNFEDREVCLLGDILWIFSITSKEIIKVNLENKDIYKIVGDSLEPVWLGFAGVYDSNIYFFEGLKEQWYKLDCDTERILHLENGLKDTRTEDEIIKEIIKYEEDVTFQYESRLKNLRYFIMKLEGNHNVQNVKDSKDIIGKRIYNAVLKKE